MNKCNIGFHSQINNDQLTMPTISRPSTGQDKDVLLYLIASLMPKKVEKIICSVWRHPMTWIKSINSYGLIFWSLNDLKLYGWKDFKWDRNVMFFFHFSIKWWVWNDMKVDRIDDRMFILGWRYLFIPFHILHLLLVSQCLHRCLMR